MIFTAGYFQTYDSMSNCQHIIVWKEEKIRTKKKQTDIAFEQPSGGHQSQKEAHLQGSPSHIHYCQHRQGRRENGRDSPLALSRRVKKLINLVLILNIFSQEKSEPCKCTPSTQHLRCHSSILMARRPPYVAFWCLKQFETQHFHAWNNHSKHFKIQKLREHKTYLMPPRFKEHLINIVGLIIV